MRHLKRSVVEYDRKVLTNAFHIYILKEYPRIIMILKHLYKIMKLIIYIHSKIFIQIKTPTIQPVSIQTDISILKKPSYTVDFNPRKPLLQKISNKITYFSIEAQTHYTI